MAIGGVCADDKDNVRLADAVEILRAGRRSEGGLQPIAGGRVADARAGIDIIVAEALAYQLLNQKSLFVRAAAGGDAADRARAVFRLDARSEEHKSELQSLLR